MKPLRGRPAAPTDVSVIVTYRCQMRCRMCAIWEHPTDAAREIRADELAILPPVRFANITGGEPFLREDIDDILAVMCSKARRVVVSTSGWHTERILAAARKFPKLGVRVSIEGLSQINDELRGRPGGFDRGLKTLLALRRMGRRDIGFGITVSNFNSEDMLWLYELGRAMNLEFATAAFHNSFYFHRDDNLITDKERVTGHFHELIQRLMRERNPKSWFRALFNFGLIQYIRGGRRILPCEAGTVNFFVDPYGEVYPCNGLEKKYWFESMGNLRTVKRFEEIWEGERAAYVREKVRTCPKNCWMVGTAAPVMKKYFRHCLAWVLRNKWRTLFGGDVPTDRPLVFEVGQHPAQGDLRSTAVEEGAASTWK